jgi:hypothetical protein
MTGLAPIATVEMRFLITTARPVLGGFLWAWCLQPCGHGAYRKPGFLWAWCPHRYSSSLFFTWFFLFVLRFFFLRIIKEPEERERGRTGSSAGARP